MFVTKTKQDSNSSNPCQFCYKLMTNRNVKIIRKFKLFLRERHKLLNIEANINDKMTNDILERGSQ